jgi:hypothetical protein
MCRTSPSQIPYADSLMRARRLACASLNFEMHSRIGAHNGPYTSANELSWAERV